MINGDATGENVSSPADPSETFSPRSDDGGDESPASLSQYSSCGESEFERYCSANSVMGTPSLCSSSYGLVNDSIESEFGSLGNFSLEGRFDRNFEDRQLSNSGVDCSQGIARERSLRNGSGGLELCENEGSCGNVGEDDYELDIQRERIAVGNGDGASQGLDFRRRIGEVATEDGREDFNEREIDSEVDGSSSSRYEHSEEDDSMYGGGSDDENRKNLYIHRSIQNSNDARADNENPLLINSSVAFGADDWDDFEQEIGGCDLASLTLDSFQTQKRQDFGTQTNLCDSASLATIETPIARQTEVGGDEIQPPACIRQVEGDKLADEFVNCSKVAIASQNSEFDQVEEVRDIPVASCQLQGANELMQDDKSTSRFSFPSSSIVEQEDDVDISVTYHPVQGANDEHLKSYSVSDIFEMGGDPPVEKTPIMFGLNTTDGSVERECLCVKSDESINSCKLIEHQEANELEVAVDPLSDKSKPSSLPAGDTEIGTEFFEDHEANSIQSMDVNNTSQKLQNNPAHLEHSDSSPTLVKAENIELNEFYDEIVNEMEEILLDSGESPGSRFPQGNHMFHSPLSLPPRDGGSTASTSGTDISFPLITQPLRIDGIEVVGAKQKKGDVSLSERLVGVKEYTVYVIRVWRGKDHWEVERRYRDFLTLYRRLKSLFADQGRTLPAPWSTVEKESRKIFGNVSPDVVSQRSVLIQECLRSILHSRRFSIPPSAFAWFLWPQDSSPSSPASKASTPRSLFSNVAADIENVSTLGKTISLNVEIRPYKSMKQMLEAQHDTCAGCHKHFDDGMTLVRDFVQTLGWGKPRLCEYTGQLFCSSCHTNETAVLPARVLHYWDFNRYPVSQLAKSYLDSIHEQPMMCVSAVNPFLFSKVPALNHVMNVRKKIGTLLPYVRCPFRRTINKGLGSRRYLLESTDFFALRDLVDLSKGPFSALPVMVENVSRKILEHITEQCLLCCDVGVPCCARQACIDPSSLIFPFQDGEIEKCPSCESVFHKLCFTKIANCPCGAALGANNATTAINSLSRKAGEYLLGRRSTSSLSGGGLLAGLLFSKANPENIKDHKDRDTVILMGSLPSTSL